MRKVIVNEWMSLDGVVQAPGAADEDTTSGFKHGGCDSQVTTTGAILAAHAPADG